VETRRPRRGGWPRPRNGQERLSRETAGPQCSKNVIDPGHGGKDPGSYLEGQIVEKRHHPCARPARGEKGGGGNSDIDVNLTRDKDTFMPSRKGPLCEHNKADLFISLHINAATNSRMSRLKPTSSTWRPTSGRCFVAAHGKTPPPKRGISDLKRF